MSAPNMPFHQLSGSKHTIRPRESVKMLDADLKGRVMEMEFFWNMQKKERRVSGAWQQHRVCREVTKTRAKRQAETDSDRKCICREKLKAKYSQAK